MLIYVPYTSVSWQGTRENRTNLLLISEATEILAIRVPRDKVRISRTQLGISLVARDLSPLEPETGINAERLVIKISRKNVIYDDEPDDEPTYSVSSPADSQLGGRLTEGTGHAGQRTASSPGDVPLIPDLS